MTFLRCRLVRLAGPSAQNVNVGKYGKLLPLLSLSLEKKEAAVELLVRG